MTDILQLMTENFVDEDCRKQCFDLASRFNRTDQGPAKYDILKLIISVFSGSEVQFINPFHVFRWLRNSSKGGEIRIGDIIARYVSIDMYRAFADPWN